MECQLCHRLDRLFLATIVFADKSETALRCYLITHQHFAGVSDLDEYEALRTEQQRTSDERHRAYMALVTHTRNHEEPLSPTGT